MGVDLTNEQKVIQRLAREFARDLKPKLPEDQKIETFIKEAEYDPLLVKKDKRPDEHYYFPFRFVQRCAELGFLGMDIPEEYGGSKLDPLSCLLVIEELAWAWAAGSLIVLVQNSLSSFPIAKFGTEEQKRKYLRRLAKGEILGCFALTEPNFGSDAASIMCRAEKVEGGWLINGEKRFITTASHAGVCVLFTRTGKPADKAGGITAFLVEIGKDAKGFEVAKEEHKMGQYGTPLCGIVFDNFFAPDHALLGEVNKGWEVASATLHHSRAWIAAQGLGIAQRALDEARKYTQERIQFGVPIIQHPPVASDIKWMEGTVENARMLTYQAALAEASGDPNFFIEASKAKLASGEAAAEVALKAQFLHGGNGYVKDYPIERIVRDGLVIRIYEGTSYIQKLILAEHEKKANS